VCVVFSVVTTQSLLFLRGFCEGRAKDTFVIRFLTRSTPLRAGLRRKEESFKSILRHDFAASTRCALLGLNAQVVP
jgi:hypothetical protein